MYTFSSQSLCLKEFYTSNYFNGQSRLASKDDSIRIVFIFATSANISWLSTPNVGVCLLATNLALYQSMVTSGLCLMVNIHLQPTSIFPFCKDTIFHIWFFCKISNSTCTVFAHFGSFKASPTCVKICIPTLWFTIAWYCDESRE